ncbi:hypothetical protein HOE67_00710 [Candidatus Peregrinibacteria bacterium]|jgi:hypothetical protein|nr:hypothetical protein [Candidatus Peregrinibacteria bacterium]MBT4055610.1 hypothetical protein [Candidatus Peregrinibacteria bacterium]
MSKQKIEIYLNDQVVDQQGLPLVVLGINGRKAIFAKQLANTFEGSKTSSELLDQLRKTGGYEEGEGWEKLSYDELKEIQTWEKTMSGKSAIESLLGQINPNGAAVVYEEAALWVLARSNTPKGREFAKLLVKTFVAVRDGAYIAAEGQERIQERLQYKKAEKDLKDTIYNRGYKRIGFFVMKGDEAFYDGYTTDQVRKKKGIPKKRALADFDTSIELTAKTLIKKTTDKNIKEHDIRDHGILKEYVKNNRIMRQSLEQMGVIPEELEPEEDYKEIEKRARKQLKESQGIKRLT